MLVTYLLTYLLSR